MTEAQRFSSVLHGQFKGQHWQEWNGIRLRDVLAVQAKKHETRMDSIGNIEDRYLLEDGSAIIVTEDGWGYELRKPWNWKNE
jgi:hypothetical protein